MAWRKSNLTRFMEKVNPLGPLPTWAPMLGPCWIWTGGTDRDGYGKITFNERRTVAHRVAYELFVGQIPDGLELDHLCRVHGCVNPWHLEPVTHQQNMSRGQWPSRSHCPQGHPYEGENLYVNPDGYKICRTCTRASKRRHYHRKAASG